LTGIKFEGDNVTAAVFAGDSSFYSIFNIRCNPQYGFDIKKFTIDILKSLESFNGTHNDIKLDNIVLCSDKYKLIDWGKSSSKDKLRFGTTTTASPIKYYIYSGLAAVGRHYFVKTKRIKSWYNFQEIVKTSEFRYQYARILKEYDAEIKSTTKQKLFEKYKDTFDVFALGMTLLYGVLHFSVDYEVYRPLIETLASVEKPLNASEALLYAKKFFRKV
jgi:serine/threonine protein kinase